MKDKRKSIVMKGKKKFLFIYIFMFLAISSCTEPLVNVGNAGSDTVTGTDADTDADTDTAANIDTELLSDTDPDPNFDTDKTPDSDGKTPPPNCGDGTLQDYESCDDGNQVSGDGCSSYCELEHGWICLTDGQACIAESCGDGIVAGGEECDDGNRRTRDGCNYFCRIESGFVCEDQGQLCRSTQCGDGVQEGIETCDDGNEESADGCDENCQLEAGYACPVPGSSCHGTTCGDGVQEGTEACDDGNDTTGDGCDENCRLEPGYACTVPGDSCYETTCGDGAVEGTEECDDGANKPGDGCSSDCELESLYKCKSEPSVCEKVTEFVMVREFPAPMSCNQAIHYDPATRSYTVYDFAGGDGVEFCLDGTEVGTRPRHGIGGRLDGATYDPSTDRFLFVQQNNLLTEVDRAGVIVRQVTLQGCYMAAGIAIGDDGRVYVADNGGKRFVVYERFDATPAFSWPVPVNGPYLDQVVNIPGEALIGAYNTPPGESERHFRFYHYDGGLEGMSKIPGVIFRSGDGAKIGLSDGAEAAPDGATFMICSAYNGVCQTFARTCQTDEECAVRVPQTACLLDAPIPYCYSPSFARDDRYAVEQDSQGNVLDVGRNDKGSEENCRATVAVLVDVSAGDQGGSIRISDDGKTIEYDPAPGFCGNETFTYTTDLGNGLESATVLVTVNCNCGDGEHGPTEECDDGNNAGGDGCSPLCTLECGDGIKGADEACDDGNRRSGDGCSEECESEDVII